MDLNLSKINKKHLIKGAIYALMLMVAPILGILMRNAGSNGYLIFGFVAVINTVAVIGVFKMLKDDLFEPVEEELEEKKKKSKKIK